MTYNNVEKGIFIKRPNRFIAHVYINGTEHVVHVKNTGRCKELLIPGCTVFLEKSDNPLRRTLYDLIAVIKKCEDGRELLINMDSQAPNKVAYEWIRENRQRFPFITMLKPEFTYGDSRFDFYIEYKDKEFNLHRMFIEVKGCTLEYERVASFPDAPTTRGVKHVRELTEIKKEGMYECGVLFIIQLKGCYLFKPNWETHEAFGIALQEAEKAGVELYAIDCNVTEDSLATDELINIDLTR